MTISTGGANFS